MNYYKEYMYEAIKESKKALRKNEIPVGCIIIKNNKIIAKAHNKRQAKNDVLGHAEIYCIKKASRKIKDWRLSDCDMYVTLEPCELCKKVIKESRINNIFYILKNNNFNIKKNKQLYAQIDDEYMYEKMFKNSFKKIR